MAFIFKGVKLINAPLLKYNRHFPFVVDPSGNIINGL